MEPLKWGQLQKILFASASLTGETEEREDIFMSININLYTKAQLIGLILQLNSDYAKMRTKFDLVRSFIADLGDDPCNHFELLLDIDRIANLETDKEFGRPGLYIHEAAYRRYEAPWKAPNIEQAVRAMEEEEAFVSQPELQLGAAPDVTETLHH
jgi:hypothetical protein